MKATKGLIVISNEWVAFNHDIKCAIIATNIDWVLGNRLADSSQLKKRWKKLWGKKMEMYKSPRNWINDLSIHKRTIKFCIICYIEKILLDEKENILKPEEVSEL